MKTKSIILVSVVLAFTLLLLNSCIVKSLHPFYTKGTTFFEKSFIGNWTDKEGGKWEVISVKSKILEESKKDSISELDSEDIEIYQKLKDGYFVDYTKKDVKSTFFAMPFKIKNQLFIDFIPFEFESKNVSELVEYHLIKTHSLVKFDILKDNNISIRWFDEDKIEELFKSNKIKIKHEKLGFMGNFIFNDDAILLTASSEELQKFIKKYMASDDDEKWKTSVMFILEKKNEKP